MMNQHFRILLTAANFLIILVLGSHFRLLLSLRTEFMADNFYLCYFSIDIEHYLILGEGDVTVVCVNMRTV